MFTILFCLARTFLPDATTLGNDFEGQAVILAVTVFAFLLYRLGSRSRPRRSANPISHSAPQ